MPTTTEGTSPTMLVLEKGAENLAGKRLLTDDFDEAATRADEIGGQVFALEPVEPATPFAPITVLQVRAAFGIADLGPEAA